MRMNQDASYQPLNKLRNLTIAQDLLFHLDASYYNHRNTHVLKRDIIRKIHYFILPEVTEMSPIFKEGAIYTLNFISIKVSN
jgi:hypothetical protein